VSVQTGEAVPSGPISRRLGDRARFRVDKWRTDPNPIWIRELKQAVRLQRTPVILCVLTMAMTMLIAGIGGLAAADSSPATTGIILFHVYFSLAYFVVTLVGPTVAANGIAAEREGRTWEAVLLAGLQPGTIARGKFLAAYTTVSLYIVMLAPVGALPFLFGGVTATETIVAFLFLFLIALMAVAFGLAVSSKMTNLRGAIAVTLLLALPFSIATFALFGPALSVAAHKAWPNVPEGPPIWLPTAYSRAPFDLTYIFALFVGPVVAVVIPSWFMYEVTVANLTSMTDDRSTGLKRWYLVSMPILTAAGVAPIFSASSASETVGVSILGACALFFILTFCIFLFQGDAIGPSRRVTAHWARVRASAFARKLGPSIMGTAVLQLVMGIFGLAVITAVGFVVAYGHRTTAYYPNGHEEILLFGAYASGFFVFMLGLGTFARARASGAMIARLILGGAVAALMLTPWVIAAIVGVIGSTSGFDDDMLSIAAPSPVFIFFAIEKHHRSSGSTAPGAALICSILYWAVGLIFLMSASKRARQIIVRHEAMLAETDRLLAQEDEAAEAARAEAELAKAAAHAEAEAAKAAAPSEGASPSETASAGSEPEPQPT
jgi:hypothetical protein